MKIKIIVKKLKKYIINKNEKNRINQNKIEKNRKIEKI